MLVITCPRPKAVGLVQWMCMGYTRLFHSFSWLDYLKAAWFVIHMGLIYDSLTNVTHLMSPLNTAVKWRVDAEIFCARWRNYYCDAILTQWQCYSTVDYIKTLTEIRDAAPGTWITHTPRDSPCNEPVTCLTSRALMGKGYELISICFVAR